MFGLVKQIKAAGEAIVKQIQKKGGLKGNRLEIKKNRKSLYKNDLRFIKKILVIRPGLGINLQHTVIQLIMPKRLVLMKH